MIIEAYLVNYLSSKLSLPVYAEEPEKPPISYALIEKLGSSNDNYIISETVAIQSYGASKLEAARLNELVKEKMSELIAEPEISRCKLNSDYPFNDTAAKRYRYQAVYDITY